MTTMRVQKLVGAVAPFVEGGETVRSAFLVQQGPPPGMEGVAGAIVGLLGLIALMGIRRWFTVVVTGQQVYLLRNRGMSRPVSVEFVAPLGRLGQVTGTGDYRLDLRSTSYTVPVPWLDEARRGQRLSR